MTISNRRVPRGVWLAAAALIIIGAMYVGLAVSSGRPLAPWHWWLGLVRACGLVDGSRAWLGAGAPQVFDDCLDPGCTEEFRYVCDTTLTR